MDSVMSKKRKLVSSELLSKEFLSQFKTEADVSKFLKKLHSQVLEQMLQGEMDSHLGYEKHSVDGNNTGNSRNGSFPKKIQTEYGDSVIRIPRDRRSEFEPVVISQAPESRIVYREVGHLALRQRNERIGYRRRASRYLWDQPLVVGHFDHHEQGHPSRRRLAEQATGESLYGLFGWTGSYLRSGSLARSSTRRSICVSALTKWVIRRCWECGSAKRSPHRSGCRF